ncbi:MAG: hypothetical protein LC753_13820 [Acidobacteria bacterium]|nr:hypothetical protein [Acidobacteriota bacterium]MCA1651299.1 hypothetical protein [Acidobacteriota bacterium]
MGRLLRSVTILALGAGLMACARASGPRSGTGTSGGAASPADREAGAPKPPADEQVKVNVDAQALAEFNERVKEYLALHNKLEATLANLSKEATPEAIDKHQRALGRLIAEARRGAKQGDIFTRESRSVIRRLLVRVFSGPDGRQLKASIMDENPGPIKLEVNGRYPDAIPLSTMPPQVLDALPRLPDELEFRFIADRLILMDVHAHIIIDIIEDALPK